VDDFDRALQAIMVKHRDRLDRGRRIYVFLESPATRTATCSTCRRSAAPPTSTASRSSVTRPSARRSCSRCCSARIRWSGPDFVIHSYTKDLAGTGTTTAGVCIGRNERMFIPKGDSVTTTTPDGKPCVYRWDESLFWNVYYIKGAFLDADKAFEVINGMRTVEVRVLLKSINTLVLARAARRPSRNQRAVLRGRGQRELRPA